MTIVVATIASPRSGKRATVESRARRLGGILARHGASVKLATVTTGPRTGAVAVLRQYDNFRAAAAAFHAANSDPEHVELWSEVESNPAADILVARDIRRVVHGKGQWDTHPVSFFRQYGVNRGNLEGALKILPEVTELLSKADVNVVGLVPVTGENLSTLTVSYQFRSLEHWAEVLDTVGTSDEFQAIVAKASQFGTLGPAWGTVPL